MKKPIVPESAYVAPSADIIGDVNVGERSSIWHHATLRADVDSIEIGEESNIQDNCVIHVSAGTPVRVGNRVTVGHSAILHSCTIDDGTLVGMGAIVLDGTHVGKRCLIAAGALVTKNRDIPDESLVMGSPAKVVRRLTEEELSYINESADEYMDAAKLMENMPVYEHEDR
ncbi:MAG: gamma carbonic anhydrase family protein [Eubacterium sp.]|nr:gamma carbonic anhydrase family protein [Eubacterium sp.]